MGYRHWYRIPHLTPRTGKNKHCEIGTKSASCLTPSQGLSSQAVMSWGPVCILPCCVWVPCTLTSCPGQCPLLRSDPNSSDLDISHCYRCHHAQEHVGVLSHLHAFVRVYLRNFYLTFFFPPLWCFWDMVSLCSPDLELIIKSDPPIPALWWLGSKACTKCPALGDTYFVDFTWLSSVVFNICLFAYHGGWSHSDCCGFWMRIFGLQSQAQLIRPGEDLGGGAWKQKPSHGRGVWECFSSCCLTSSWTLKVIRSCAS